MIKYLGSKRVLLPVLGTIAEACEARVAWDLFTGTTRVAQEFKRRGISVAANDLATYSYHLARCFIELDRSEIDLDTLDKTIQELNNLPGKRGYFTEVFCEKSRFFQPHNGMRIDAIRDEIENKYRDSWMYSPLLVALMLAADKVDSTVGVQMAYLKSWAQRSYGEMTLRTPDIPEGPGGLALCEDAVKLVRDYAGAVKSSEGGTVPEADVTILSQAPQYADIYSQEAINKLHTPDLIYIDPPYNQHKYFSNYHIWETLIRWDDPVPYGVAHKREDARSAQNSSAFNSKPRIYSALMDLFTSCYDSGAKVIMVSYNNESWIDRDSMHDALSQAGWGNVQSLAFSSKRYVGSQIGVHNQAGERVGVPGADKNIEYVFLAGNRSAIRRAVTAIESGNAGQRSIDEQSVT